MATFRVYFMHKITKDNRGQVEKPLGTANFVLQLTIM